MEMTDAQGPLRQFEQKHDFLIAIDSDGSAFDTMEVKHKKCFIPNTIKHWGLQPVSESARTVAEFVNLYSKWRGINRFPALILTFDLLREMPEVERRGAVIPVAQPLRDWIARETRLSNPALKAEVERTGDDILRQALNWSEGINASVEEIVKAVPPFRFVVQTLEKVSECADILVCSVAPRIELVREWQEHGLARFTTVIAGQEMGIKRDQIQLASKGRYDKNRVIMLGDSPADLKAAKDNQALFFPINPGLEEESWERFLNEAAELFHQGRYSAEYEGQRIAEFESRLPGVPPWKRKSA